MAKRNNQNSRKRADDDYDDKTVIKIAPPKAKKKATPTRRAGTSESKSTRSNTSRSSTKATDNKRKDKPKIDNPRKEAPNKNKGRATPRKTNTASTTNKSVKKTITKTPPKSTESKTPSKSSPSPTVQKTVTPPSVYAPENIKISQSVAILIDGNNIEMSLTKLTNNKSAVLNFDKVIPKLLNGRGLNRLIYFREGRSISQKLADRLHTHYFGSVVPCHKSADIPLSIQATQLAEKVDTIIILSGDSDYVELVRHVKSKGVRVEIAAIEMTTASILIEEADYYRPITKEDAFIVKN